MQTSIEMNWISRIEKKIQPHIGDQKYIENYIELEQNWKAKLSKQLMRQNYRELDCRGCRYISTKIKEK